jgi:hypothetical protein
MVTQERLKELLKYNKDNGIFYWKNKRGRKKAGAVAGRRHTEGYIRITIDGKDYLAHRLALLYMNGEMPNGLVDHINRDRDDNRFANLRVVNPCENQYNRNSPINNSSGVVGASLCRQTSKWLARISVKSKRIHLGRFLEKEDAISAVKEARIKHHKIGN